MAYALGFAVPTGFVSLYRELLTTCADLLTVHLPRDVFASVHLIFNYVHVHICLLI
jgi:hypothetical protein